MSVASQAERRRPRWGRVLAILVGVPVVVVVAMVVLFVVGHLLNARPVPSFPSLVAAPDVGLHGTVAYTDESSRCVRVVAASGASSREVLCLGPFDPANQKAGKEAGPQLRWLADGRLEVTMFRMTGRPGYVASWQKVVDVPSGKVTEVPASALPAAPDRTSGRASTSPAGDRVQSRSDPSNGKVRITLSRRDGSTRTLLSVQGPGEYTYGLDSVFWSPTWDWVAANDGRILVVTTGATPVTRVLVPNAYDEADLPRFAVTAADLLP